MSTSPLVQNGVVYFGSSDGKLYALNALSGNLVWSFNTGGQIGSCGPTMANGILYIGSRSNTFYAINATTGASIWEIPFNVSMEHSSPTVINNIVYIAGGFNINTSAKGSVYAFNATTGQLIWESLANTGFSASPIVANGQLFIAGTSDFYALNAANGVFQWSKAIYPNNASATVINNIVCVGGGASGYFYALDVTNGSEKWKFSISGTFVSGPCIVTPTSVKHSGESGMQQ